MLSKMLELSLSSKATKALGSSLSNRYETEFSSNFYKSSGHFRLRVWRLTYSVVRLKFNVTKRTQSRHREHKY